MEGNSSNDELRLKQLAVFGKEKLAWLNSFYTLQKDDFNHLEDGRVLRSGIYDMPNGDTYERFLKQYYRICEENGVYD